MEGITARQGNRLCDYPQGKPVSTSCVGGQTFFLRTVFRKRHAEGRFACLESHFYFSPNQNTPCSQGVFWFGQLYQLGNWKAGKTFIPTDCRMSRLYQLGNWKAGKTSSLCRRTMHGLYQLGNWKAGKTSSRGRPRRSRLYQLGNWKAGKTCFNAMRSRWRLYQLGNWKAGKTPL